MSRNALAYRGLRGNRPEWNPPAPDPNIYNKGRRFAIYQESLAAGMSAAGNSATISTAANSGNPDDSGPGEQNNKCVGDFGCTIIATASAGSAQINFNASIDLRQFDSVIIAGGSGVAGNNFALRFGAAAGGFCGGYRAMSPDAVMASSKKLRMYRFLLRGEAASSGATLTATDPIANAAYVIDLNAAWPTPEFRFDHIILVKHRLPQGRMGKYWRPSRLGSTNIMAKAAYHQIPNERFPLVDHNSNYWTGSLNPNWSVYQKHIKGDFVGQSTEQAIEYYARKWGFQKGCFAPTAYESVKTGLPTRALPFVGVDYDVSMDHWLAFAAEESLWNIAAIGDYRLLTGVAGSASGVAAWTSFGNIQINRQNWGGYPGTYESIPYSLDAGFANLRHFVDGSNANGTSTYAPQSWANDGDRLRAGMQGYFWGSYTNEASGDPTTGHWIANLWGGPCYQHGNHDANNWRLNADWLDAGWAPIDFPTF